MIPFCQGLCGLHFPCSHPCSFKYRSKAHIRSGCAVKRIVNSGALSVQIKKKKVANNPMPDEILPIPFQRFDPIEFRSISCGSLDGLAIPYIPGRYRLRSPGGFGCPFESDVSRLGCVFAPDAVWQRGESTLRFAISVAPNRDWLGGKLSKAPVQL